ncbi:endospore germination permease [Paenibacillus sp. GYB003]|uniref:endospore germination permease n=1 Tax=Paenibacillus sp. GYB003 TaxID=2994392 RepID=UPI002F9617FB
MLQSIKPISPLAMYMTLILSVGISNHVLLVPVLLETAKRDAWIGATAACIPVIVWAGILHVVLRKTGNESVNEWVERRHGKTVRRLMSALFVVYLFAAALISLADTVMWTKVTYLPKTPKTVIAVVLTLLCYFGAKAGIRAIAIAAAMLLPGVVALGYFVASANLQYKDYSLLTPLFTHGYMPSVRALLYTSGSVLELVIVLFMKHHVSTALRTRGMIALGIIAVGLTVGPLTGAISVFGPFEAAEQRYPAFEQWRMVTLGKFISHLDFFSIYQWISGSFVRVSLMLYLLTEHAGRMRRNYVLSGGAVLMAAIVSVPFNDVTLASIIANWYFPGISVLGACFGLALFVLSLVPASGRKESAKT